MKCTPASTFLVAGALLLASSICSASTSLRGVSTTTSTVTSVTTGSEHERDLYDENTVLCRIVTFGTSYSSNDDESHANLSSQRRACVPIVHGVESDMDFPIHLPEEMKARHSDQMDMGQLLVLVSPATFENDQLDVASNAEYFIVDDRRLTHLTTRHLQVKKEMTVAFIRISTNDGSPPDSLAAIKSTHFTAGGTNFITQYDQCSHGNMQWKLAATNGVIDVKVPIYASSYKDNVGGFTTAVQQYMKQNGYPNGVAAIADKVIMCIPPGTGTWAASAGLNHWRVQMNSDWCRSLSAAVQYVSLFSSCQEIFVPNHRENKSFCFLIAHIRISTPRLYPFLQQ
jgi:hypothetical protein